MKEIKLSTGEWLLVEVPEGVKGLRTMNVWGINYVCDGHLIDDNEFIEQLPSGQYSIVGLAKDLTEEQWKGIAEKWNWGKWNDYSRHLARVETATESGLSLLKSNSMEANRCLVLRKEKL